jgi:hypothetical protein
MDFNGFHCLVLSLTRVLPSLPEHIPFRGYSSLDVSRLISINRHAAPRPGSPLLQSNLQVDSNIYCIFGPHLREFRTLSAHRSPSLSFLPRSATLASHSVPWTSRLRSTSQARLIRQAQRAYDVPLNFSSRACHS